MDQFEEFLRSLKEANLINVGLGALGGITSDLLIDIPLSAAGLLKALEWKDAQGRWIWGIGTGDVVNFAAGAGMAIAGVELKKKDLTEAGLGWLLAAGISKVSELYGYLSYLFNVHVTGAQYTQPSIPSEQRTDLGHKVIKL